MEKHAMIVDVNQIYSIESIAVLTNFAKLHILLLLQEIYTYCFLKTPNVYKRSALMRNFLISSSNFSNLDFWNF